MKQLESEFSKTTISVDNLVATQESMLYGDMIYPRYYTYIYPGELLTKVYAWLTPLSIVFENKQRGTFATKARQDTGARALLETGEFTAWRNSTGTTLWCTGMRE